MNKLSKCLLSVSLAATVVGAGACGGAGSDAWKGTTFTDYGAVDVATLGGFVAETANYVYFINGVGSSSSDNTFGTPIKGALVAAKKGDLSKAEVVVPELMVSTDYDAGVFVYGSGEETYVYYGTPNREKNSSGSVAYSEMTFTKTRLDGKKSEKLFTVSSHSVNYRIAEKNGVVYIVYYDADANAIVSYNCSEKKSTVIAKTDAKNNEKNAAGEYLSLGAYKFLKGDAQIAYTLTVYTEEYFAAKEEQTDSYSRETATYNYMYIYSAGEEPRLVKDGKTAGDATYAITSYVDGYLFYTETKVGGKAITFGAKPDALDAAEKINYSANVKDGAIIKALDEIYYFDSDSHKIVRTTLVKTAGDEFSVKETIANDESISALISVENDYVYYYDTDGYIVALERTADGTGRQIRVSERTAAKTWYAPEKVSLSSGEYLLYCDSSAAGNSYVYYADLGGLAAPQVKDTDDDGETDLYYLESSFIGVMPASDRAAIAVADINAIESSLELKEDAEGKTYSESVKKARTAYDALDEDAKKQVAASDLNKLVNAENAVKLGAAFLKLEPVVRYEFLTAEQKTALTADYNAAKTVADGIADYDAAAAYLNDNLKYYYQEVAKKIESAS
ncbi:MAG: hypothetical protein IJU83_02635 [Clostridia bacterium]|nr:hypothetical protein [Clostridia bacterium]